MSHAEQETVPFLMEDAPLWQRMICRRLNNMTQGRLTVIFPGGYEYVVKGSEPGAHGVISLNRGRVVRRLLMGGSLGFAQAYIDGDWDTPDIAALLEVAIANEKNWSSVSEPSKIFSAFAYLRHRLRRNSKSGSRRNISFHYDLGNRFYSTWLDETMTYSSALFQTPGQSLADAQNAKYDRIVEQLKIGPDDHVLEIGCGWGGFAEYAVGKTGCRVTGLTLSREQADFARNRLAKAGMSDRTDIRLEDYRDCQGRYSKIVSIEMFEAVGEENWPTYFRRVRELLAPGGEAMVQVITIDETRFDDYRRNADFIQTYIFPGGMLPTITAFREAAAVEGFTVPDMLRFGKDYDHTLMLWDRAFVNNWQRIEPLGFDERFRRMWQYYLHYCAAGFRAGTIDVVQFQLKAS
ncbi:class I SAM-dependent methyltransferase [Agrobacterium rosae]|uniref:Cyclopropane-fatty-acyl-phospholipid synthase family protein n=1 Tax=Agrobacterium rosae TaxID=1972867 RepID=A0AAE5S1Q4_9HYPH|nr:cyclopropane-fatty-acyl-phospholipid synthase family protein [Agrobacterium rosae]KAA3510890.1 class I SAM-dependent methyltransferase [Agrobacterium rosae]KAA3517927.1 class I SAM-dependent methyltransferase [Agrobacterium rosae]MCM2434198.1 class I SAM-dependent methyltransferase [Agrobacterium rosae]MDX8314507.1 cyclopropane-fatty-acyl-phospholipid synthase family protein [Agrobacterium rosae]MDX8329535.1 cyclopropane-fatty-acyl-phospholipid synthase family protein [Agrobacterium rosae]